VGVVAVVADEVESWRRDVHEHPRQELGRVEGLTAALERPLVAIEGKPRLEAEALERQRRSREVSRKPLDPVIVIGPNGDRIMGRKAGVT